MTKISIIVPVYNASVFLRKCLDSLVNQTLKDIEIILIDDASTDNTSIIMEEYKKKYSMIQCVYLEQNIGQGEARNKGIEISQGKYIMFVDSDDWIDITMCDKLYNRALEEDYDIVGCDYYRVQEFSGKKLRYSLYFNQQEGELDKDKRASLLLMFSIPVCKLIKKEMLLTNDLYFPPRIKYEDFAVVPLYFFYSKNMGIVDEALYYYLTREDSTSLQMNAPHHGDVIRSAIILYNEILNRGFKDYEEEAEGLYIRQLMNGLRKYVELYNELDEDALKTVKNMTAGDYPSCKQNHYYYSTNEVGRKVFELLHDDYERIIHEYQEGILSKTNLGYAEYYRYNEDKLNNLQDYCRENNFKVAIWGAGLKGNDFLKVYDEKVTKNISVVDRNIKNHGTRTATGHEISSSSICEEMDLIIAMSRNAYASIREEARAINSKIKVINLDLYLLMKNIAIDVFVE